MNTKQLFSMHSLRMLCILLLGGSLILSCTSDYSDALNPDKETTVPGTLSMCISMPGVNARQPDSDTRSLAIEDEYSLKRENLHILLFKHNGGSAHTDNTYIFKRRLTPTEAGWGSGSTDDHGNFLQTFRISLNEEEENDELKAMIVGNLTEAQMAAYDTQFTGLTLAESNGLIRFEQNDGAIWKTEDDIVPLPLWGKTDKPFSPLVTAVSTVNMLRAVARIDVGVNLTGGDGNGRYDLTELDGRPIDLDGHSFEIESVQLFKATRSGSLAPDAANYDEAARKVTAATIDPNHTTYHTAALTYTKAYDMNSGSNMLRRQIYQPEVKNHGIARNEEAFHIVVGGSYNSHNTSYYRLDFYNRDPQGNGVFVKPDADNRYDILRNHAYIINILRVRGDGYATPEIASASEPVNMEVDIRSWDTGDALSNITTDGQYRLALSARTLNYHTDGTAQELSVLTDYLLAGNADESGWKMSVVNSAQEDLLLFYDEQGNVIPKAQWVTAGVTRGIANVISSLRVGLKPYTPDTDGRMERTVTLRFKAGRMTADVLLVQDVLSTVSLDISPARIDFTRTPHALQFFTAKPSPATDVTLYACWEDAVGTQIEYNITNPTDPNNAAFAIPPAFLDDADDKERKFFARESENAPIFSLLPTKWDEAANGGTNPTVPRVWRFTIKAKWNNGSQASKVLEVEQSAFQLMWDLYDRQGGNLLADKTLTISAAGGTLTPYVNTNPEVKWYLPSYTETGNIMGEKWLKNWSTLTGNNYTGSTPLSFEIAPNPGISSRSLVIQAASDADGFDRYSNRITINQPGGDLLLELQRGIGTENTNLTYNAGTQTYTLDFGIALDAALKGVTVRANTDWWWQWTAGGGTALVPYTYHLAEGHPYYDKWLIEQMQRFILPGKEKATTGNSSDSSLPRNWENAFNSNSPRGYFLSMSATTDDELKRRNIPLAGEYWTELQLFNTHSRLDESVEADKQRIEKASKKLRIKRTIPSLWYASKLPFEGRDYVNLGNFTETGTKHWNEQGVIFGSNNNVELTITRSSGGSNYTETLVPTTTYETKEIPQVLRKVVQEADVDYTKGKITYTLTLKGKRQTVANQPDQDYSIKRTYYSGYEMLLPTMENCSKGAQLSNGSQTIVFNFSNSTYHKAQQVRVARQAFDTNGNILAGDVTYTSYTLNGALYQRYISYAVPHNPERGKMYAYYVQYQPYGSTEWKSEFKDGVSKPEPGSYYFVQDAATGAGGLIYGKNTTKLDDLPGVISAESGGYMNGIWDVNSFWVDERPSYCKLTNRVLYAAQPGGRYHTGGTDYRLNMYLISYREIYGQDVTIMKDLKIGVKYLCREKQPIIGSNYYKHYEYHAKTLWGNASFPNLHLEGYGCKQWDRYRHSGFYPIEVEFWYNDQYDNSSKSMSVLTLTDPFGGNASQPPIYSYELYGTKN